MNGTVRRTMRSHLLAFGKAARRAGGGKFDGTINIAGSTKQYSGGNQKYDISAVEGKVTFSLKRRGAGVLLADHGRNSKRRQHQD